MVALLSSAVDAQPPAVLYNGTNASGPERLLAMTLAGIVNRDSARLYLLNVYETWSYTQTDEQWRDLYRSRGGVVFDSIASVTELVNRFRSFVQGGVSYDANRLYGNFSGQSFRWQGEYACLIGGLTDRLPVTAAMANTFGLALADSLLVEDRYDGDAAVWAPGKLEYPLHAWNNGSLTEEQRYMTLLQWGVATLLPRCHPSKFYIREITDWAVKHRMFQVNIAGTSSLDLFSVSTAKADILDSALTFLHRKNLSSIFHIYGWMYPEPMTQWFAFFGASFHETLLGNLSWHSAFPVALRLYLPTSRVLPDTAIVRDKYYVLFIGSEGDAANWVFSFQSGAWLSAQRGTLPIGWGMNFHLLDECPFVASYYYDTATPADGFMPVTSPLGYSYPDDFPASSRSGAVSAANALMTKYGVTDWYGYKHYAGTGSTSFRGVTIYNSFDFPTYGSFLQASGATMSFVYDPQLPSQAPVTSYGSVMFSHTGDGSFYGDASDPNTYATRIVNILKSTTRPKFLLGGYQRFRQDNFATRPAPEAHDISVTRLAQVVTALKADPIVGPHVEVVTPQHFSVLLRKQLGILAVDDQPSQAIPDRVAVSAFPNPFNPRVSLTFSVPADGPVRVRVIDLLGREVALLIDAPLPAGEHRASWSALHQPSGVYVAVVESPSGRALHKLVLAK
jgi:hypothetical protein